MRRRMGPMAIAACVIVAGCGSDDPPETPVACSAPASGYLTALESAPGEVRLDGTTPISDCLIEEQEPGQLATVGESIVAAATELNSEVLRTGDERSTVQLGYLVGAVQEAASTTGGIHEDLVLRLDSAARYAPGGNPFSVDFERAFGEGYAAGQANG